MKVIQASAHSMSSRRKDDVESKNSFASGSRGEKNAWATRRASGQSCEVKARGSSVHSGAAYTQGEDDSTQRVTKRPPRFGTQQNEDQGRFRTRLGAMNRKGEQSGATVN